jgi:thimet oligopeptidase
MFMYDFVFSVILLNSDLKGSNVRVSLSASEILKLAGRVIAKSKEVHDAVASVPLDKVSTDF